jgi:hypothetical protein
MTCFRTAVLALAFSATQALAQSALDLAEEYATMPEVQQMMDEMFSPESMIAQFEMNLPASVVLTDDQRTRVGTLLSDTMNEMKPRMQEMMIAGSAKYFSVDELQALIDFYRSEHGASVMSKMQPFFQETMAQLAPEIQQKMQDVGPQIIEIIQGE